ncbi:hypothetical protein BDK89_2690 [Ilumatobacter fluminis]|uniref:Heparinase II/III-like protein n=1 Tax=Ilumatobacter fluminis TaxID=467091 RepID=A0A4R7I368_9ACTN|nr:hypothetical protein [Ilumatobacter fluminis]TDT17086.1 hypothetical protein BDK89_2690 [Ilumatobacter fluminis]
MLRRREFLTGGLSLAAIAACSGTESSSSTSTSAGATTAPSTSTTPTTTPSPATTAPLATTSTLPSAPASPIAPPGTPGLVDEAFFRARVDSYLEYASVRTNPGNPTGIVVQLAQARRDPSYWWDIDAVTVEALQPTWTKIDEWRDTRDFDFMYLNWVYALGRGDTDTTRIDPGVIDAIALRTIANRYRYDDPLPDDRIDHLWYWSENHRLITLANECLAGEMFPDETFPVTGMTGAEHAARAKPDILEWINERGRFGFFEWHSNVYMAKNVTPLLMLCELSDDDDLVRAAAVGLDACLLDMASHYHRGAYVAPHGRTYKKDKMTARDEDTFDLAKMLFDRTPGGYESTTSTTATYFGAATRYRPPALVLDVAHDDSTTVTRERHGVWADASEPITDDPVAPFGYDYDDPANLPFWWSLGAVGMWQLAEVGTAQADEFRLWEGDAFTQVKLLSDAQGGDVEAIKAWEQANPQILNLGFLAEANTYAWRSPQVSLAAVLDHRKGELRDQGHAWQATIDPDARVFTTHPMTDRAESNDWNDDGDPGYWTGEASMPRSAQFERTAVHLYLPAYDETTDALLGAFFPYRPFTHAYFPTDHFDEVREVGNWVVGSKSGGYVALWSWRPTAWREYPAGVATNGMTGPFDLVADGGPDNAWIVEVGNEDDGTFDEFVTAVTSTEPQVERTDTGFDVAWTSPTAGTIEFGWDAPFVVDGTEQPISEFPRHDSPWGTVERLETNQRYQTTTSGLTLDFESFDRIIA